MIGLCFNYSIDIFDFIIEINKFDENIPGDIEYTIYEIWKNGDKKHINMVPDSYHLYSHEIIREKAIDCAFQDLYERKMENKNG